MEARRDNVGADVSPPSPAQYTDFFRGEEEAGGEAEAFVANEDDDDDEAENDTEERGLDDDDDKRSAKLKITGGGRLRTGAITAAS